MNITAGQWRRIIVAFLVTSALLTMFCSAKLFAASTLEDGEYTINFEILKGDPKDDSTSLANGYWNKPATVIVKNGEITVRTVINKDAWVIEFATKQGSSFVDEKVISRDSNNDSRVVEFKASSLEQDLVTSMTVDIPSQNYYHEYETRFRFYPDSLKLVKAAESDVKAKPEPTAKPTSTPASNATASNSGSVSSDNTTSSATAKPTASATSTSTSLQGSSSASQSSEGAKDQVTTGGGTSSSANTSGAAGEVSSNTASSTADPNGTSGSEGQLAIAGDGEESATNNNEDSEQSTEDASSAVDTDDASNSESGEIELSPLTASGETVSASSAAVSNEQENESGSTTLVIILIVIAAVFVIGSIIWLVRKSKTNK
jgi:hypothetical protein